MINRRRPYVWYYCSELENGTYNKTRKLPYNKQDIIAFLVYVGKQENAVFESSGATNFYIGNPEILHQGRIPCF